MAGLLYPATILNGAGDSVGTIGTPSAGFRRVPELEPGALAFTSAEGMGAQAGNPIKRLIESFDLPPCASNRNQPPQIPTHAPRTTPESVAQSISFG